LVGEGDEMKAWCVYVGQSPYEAGCVLIYAHTRNQAKAIAYEKGPWFGCDYIDFRAKRVGHFDKYYNQDFPNYFELNTELPPGTPDFFDDNVY
jgi:hypothetical protein